MNNRPGNFKAYDIDSCITEIYDQFETQREDIQLLRGIIGQDKPLKILEPFCGNGRILIPMAQDGHKIVGLDKSPPMLESSRKKIQKLPVKIQRNITLKQANVLTEEWPKRFDLVILGGNCLYELATPEEQETCIHKAQKSLKPNGFLYLDNDHMEGDLDPKWRKPGIGKAFPTGICADGTKVQGTTEIVWYDIKNRLVHEKRVVTITFPDGKTSKKEWLEQCHAPSTVEMKTWLNKYGFVIENLWGSRQGSPYTDESERAIFWAKLSVK